MKMPVLLFLITLSFLFQGCLTFHRISYELTLEDDLKGNGVIYVYDIRSDAVTDKDFEEDKRTLFEYMLKEKQFLTDMKNEGKEITSRRLFSEDDKLNGEAEFNFDDIRKVEGISFEDGFYYITMELEDSIYSTNGEIIISDDFKRIVWDKNTKVLSFEMMAADYDDMYYRELASYFED